ncbi:cystatin-A1-like [Sarcoptes scabiei]|nr:cystatin-A1-like [Sarcoptes scabiei]
MKKKFECKKNSNAKKNSNTYFMDARCGLLSNISLEYFRNRRDNFHFLLSHTRIKRFSLALKFSKSFFLLNSLLSFFSYHSEFHHFMFKKKFFFSLLEILYLRKF